MTVFELLLAVGFITTGVCAYLWGGVVGYRKGANTANLNVFRDVGESMGEILRELNVTQEQINVACNKVMTENFIKAGLTEDLANDLTKRFLKK